MRSTSARGRALPPVRGTLTAGPADGGADLAARRRAGGLAVPAGGRGGPRGLPRGAAAGVPVFPMGVGSNLIVRDGGIAGVVIRLGRGFNGIRVEGDRVIAGAAALDAHVARQAAEAGHRPDLPADHPRRDRRRGADERRLLRHLHRRRLRLGAGGDAGGRAGRARAGATWASPTARRALPDGLVITEVTLTGPRGEPGGAGAADGGAAARGATPASRQGALGRLDLPQSGGVLLHRAGRRRARPEGLEADRGRRA